MEKKRKTISLFNPSRIAEALRDALNLDLPLSTQYDGGLMVRDSSLLFTHRQINELTRKFKSENKTDNENLRSVAIESFHRINDEMGRFNSSFNDRATSFRDLDPDGNFLALNRARNFLAWVLEEPSLEELFRACRHSGGTTNGTKYADTSFTAKFTYPITYCNEGTRRLFETYLEYDKQLANCIATLNKLSTEPCYKRVFGSKTTTVPKNDTTDRVIALEPTLEMFFQQGIMTMLYDRLSSIGVDLSVTPFHHHKLAFEASLTRNWATIDFKDASSSVSICLFKYLMPPKWCGLISSVKTDKTVIDGEWYELNMISTMGNATTFPVESLIFLALMYAALYPKDTCSTLVRIDQLKYCSVFGDDCLILSEHAPRFIDLAKFCGFTVNEEKSFYKRDVPFRESCGHDYHYGRNVRPFYLRAPVSCNRSSLEPWLNTIMNGLLKKYISYFGDQTYVYRAGLFSWYVQMMQENNLLIRLVPPDMPDDSGLQYDGDKRMLLVLKGLGARFATISSDNHGCLRYSYVRFRYRESIDEEYVSYWKQLKFPPRNNLQRALLVGSKWSPRLLSKLVYSGATPQSQHTFPKKQHGGYVGSAGYTSTWLGYDNIELLKAL